MPGNSAVAAHFCCCRHDVAIDAKACKPTPTPEPRQCTVRFINAHLLFKGGAVGGVATGGIEQHHVVGALQIRARCRRVRCEHDDIGGIRRLELVDRPLPLCL